MLREKSAVSIAVSILDRFAANRHLSDDVLAQIWSTAVAEGQPARHPHMSACAECRFRYTAFTSWLDEIRDEAHAEADQALPAERLAAQHAQIFRRLEALERPARVIAFPRSTRPSISTGRVSQRWVATAAAAGLVIGIAAGQLVDLRRALQPVPRQAGSVVAGGGSPLRPGNLTPVSTLDEAFLYGDLEASARSARDSSLRAFDDFTPRARDYDR
jgi:hypothetical protein